MMNSVLPGQASDRHLMVVQRLSVLSVGLVATAISLSVPIIYGIFILAADIVYVIILPQLTYAIFLAERGSALGSVAGFLVGVVMRVGAGEPTVGLQPFIYYSDWSPETGQWFPFRTAAMMSSGLTIVLLSEIVRILRQRNFGSSDGEGSEVSVVKVSKTSRGVGVEERTAVSDQEMSLLNAEDVGPNPRNSVT